MRRGRQADEYGDENMIGIDTVFDEKTNGNLIEIRMRGICSGPDRICKPVSVMRAKEIVGELLEGCMSGSVFTLPEEFNIVGRIEYNTNGEK